MPNLRHATVYPGLKKRVPLKQRGIARPLYDDIICTRSSICAPAGLKPFEHRDVSSRSLQYCLLANTCAGITLSEFNPVQQIWAQSCEYPPPVKLVVTGSAT